MDHRIYEELDRQTAQRIQLVQKELAWEHEKHLLGLQKLQKRWVLLFFCFWPYIGLIMYKVVPATRKRNVIFLVLI